MERPFERERVLGRGRCDTLDLALLKGESLEGDIALLGYFAARVCFYGKCILRLRCKTCEQDAV